MAPVLVRKLQPKETAKEAFHLCNRTKATADRIESSYLLKVHNVAPSSKLQPVIVGGSWSPVNRLSSDASQTQCRNLGPSITSTVLLVTI